MKVLSAKHVQSPSKRVLYRNDIKHVKVKTEERMASLMENNNKKRQTKSCLRISAKKIHFTLMINYTPAYFDEFLFHGT